MLSEKNILTQFDEIEKKLEQVMGVLRTLEEKNSELAGANERLREELQTKTETEAAFIRERELIRSKISGILTKLEDISEASK
ncbi:MAG: hypothetical protein AB1659_02775 [Thermodesulfobacteriota bacterium]